MSSDNTEKKPPAAMALAQQHLTRLQVDASFDSPPLASVSNPAAHPEHHGGHLGNPHSPGSRGGTPKSPGVSHRARFSRTLSGEISVKLNYYKRTYEECKRLGHGTFGSAVLVRRIKDNRLLVAKKMQVGGEESDTMWRNEVDVLQHLDNINIVQYVDHFEEDGWFYILTEFAEDGTLADHIKSVAESGETFSEAEVWDIFTQIVLALEHAHAAKVIHRDVKPSNIFISTLQHDDQDSEIVVKLGDFGVSKLMESSMDMANTVLGTPFYLSPEVCEGKPYDFKSDVWSLGCILYEVAMLSPPFSGANMPQVIMKIARGKYPPLSEDYSQELHEVLAACLSKDIAQRPTMEALLKMPPVQQSARRSALKLQHATIKRGVIPRGRSAIDRVESRGLPHGLGPTAPTPRGQHRRSSSALGSSTLREGALSRAPLDKSLVDAVYGILGDLSMSAVKCVAISADGCMVVAGHSDHTVRAYSVRVGSLDPSSGGGLGPSAGYLTHELVGHFGEVYAVLIDGGHIVSGSGDCTIRVWSIETGECEYEVDSLDSAVNDLALGEGRLLAGMGDGTVGVYEWAERTYELLHTIEGHSDRV
eukprot:CAMPEP_0182908254 /NCGR_PEP_ID=MMETSP0034_2-20130328/35107_1 /TAXON_ID=156128 /ORGANISM="Nephroselmis pyriformis, Strain CCMP717" /LENGTH=589 /DNA_ID=CAMNT_0025044421 /DNA_START=163 /DNA_END=1929 /DNA_ORIENTATION=+